MKHFWQKIKDKLTKIDYFFLGFIVLMALFFTFAIPPTQKPDEITHYQKSVDVAHNNFFRNDLANKKLVSDFIYNWSTYIGSQKITNKYNKKFYLSQLEDATAYFSNQKITSANINLPIMGYLISALGIKVGMLFNNPEGAIIGFYLARFLNLLFFFFSVLVALYLIPKNYKFLLFSFLLFPMLLHQAGAISYDSFLNSLVIIIFSYLINLALRFQENKKVEKKEFFIILLLLVISTLIKSGYYLLFLLIFLLPFWKLFKKKSIYFLSIFFAITLIFFFSANITRGLTNSIKEDAEKGENYIVENENNRSAGKQLILLKKNPLFVKTIIIDTSFNKSDEYFNSLIGVFGALDAPLPFFIDFLFSLIITAMLVYQIWITKKENIFNWRQLWLIFLISFGTIGLIIFSFYFIWTPVGASIIEGVQGRYFLPLIPFVFLFFVELVKKMGLKKFFYKFVIYSLIIVTLFILYVVFQRYWNYKVAAPIKTDYQASVSATLKEE